MNGSRFVNGDVVHWNGFFGDSALVTTFVSATQLTAVVPAAITANSGTATVTVDQQKKPEVSDTFHHLGTFRFEKGKAGSVTVWPSKR